MGVLWYRLLSLFAFYAVVFQKDKNYQKYRKMGISLVRFPFHNSSITGLCYISYLQVFLLSPLNKWEFETEANNFHFVNRKNEYFH